MLCVDFWTLWGLNGSIEGKVFKIGVHPEVCFYPRHIKK